MRKSDKAATRGAADLQAQLAGAWSQQFGRSGETYGRLYAAMRDELTEFVQRRVDANMATLRAWSECRSVNDVFAVQQNFTFDPRAGNHIVHSIKRTKESCLSTARRTDKGRDDSLRQIHRDVMEGLIATVIKVQILNDDFRRRNFQSGTAPNLEPWRGHSWC